MKILFVCHRLPYPPNRGGKIRSFHMISHLAQKHSVVVASLAHTREEFDEGKGLEKYCDEVIAEVLPDSQRWLQALKAGPTSTPSSVAYFWSSRLYRRIQEKMDRTKFDLIFVHCAFTAQYVVDAKEGFRVLDYGDIDSAKWLEYSHWKAFPLGTAYGIEAKKLRRYEIDVASRFHRCTVTTHGEKEEFESFGTSVPCSVIPNGVNTDYFSPTKRAEGRNPVIAFVGRMDYFPNIDGVCYFVEKVLPIIRARIPAVELRIIGSQPSARIRELSAIPGIFVSGHVPDVRPHLNDAHVSIAPLRIARGTQNKVLESMAMGIPVVATPQAARGIQAVPGRDLLVGSEAEDFAKHVINLLENADLRHGFSHAALKQMEAAHLWPSSMNILDEVIAEVSTGKTSRTPRNYAGAEAVGSF